MASLKPSIEAAMAQSYIFMTAATQAEGNPTLDPEIEDLLHSTYKIGFLDGITYVQKHIAKHLEVTE